MGMADILGLGGSLEYHIPSSNDNCNKEREGGDLEVVISGFDVCLE